MMCVRYIVGGSLPSLFSSCVCDTSPSHARTHARTHAVIAHARGNARTRTQMPAGAHLPHRRGLRDPGPGVRRGVPRLPRPPPLPPRALPRPAREGGRSSECKRSPPDPPRAPPQTRAAPSSPGVALEAALLYLGRRVVVGIVRHSTASARLAATKGTELGYCADFVVAKQQAHRPDTYFSRAGNV